MTATTVTIPLWRQLLAPYALLRGSRNLDLLLAAHTISRLVQWLYFITLLILAYQLSHSATALALLTLVRIVTNSLMLPVSGALTDRVDARLVMMISLGGRAISMLGLLAVQSPSTLWIAYPALFAATVFAAPFQTALMTFLPSVTDDRHLLESTSLVTQAEFLTQGIGPAVGGAFVALGDIHLGFLLAAVTFVVTLVLVALIRVPHADVENEEREESWLERTLGGFLFLLRERDHILVALSLSLAGIGVINGANYTLIIVLSDRAFHFGDQGAAFLNATYGLASLAGGLLLGPLISRRSIAPVFLGMALVDCVAAILFGFSPGNALAYLFMALGGVTDTATKVTALAVVQIAAPRALFGRVFTAFESSLLAGQALGSFVVGPLIVFQGPRYATFTLAMVGVVALAVTLPWILRVERVFGLRIFLRNVPILTDLATNVLDQLSDRFALEHVPPGTAIVREGEVGDRFYIVKQGKVKVVAHGDAPIASHVATLSRLDYFGEIALLHDVPRTATVIADRNVEVYSLTRHDFQELVAQSEAFRDKLHGISAARDVDLQTKVLVTA